MSEKDEKTTAVEEKKEKGKKGKFWKWFFGILAVLALVALAVWGVPKLWDAFQKPAEVAEETVDNTNSEILAALEELREGQNGIGDDIDALSERVNALEEPTLVPTLVPTLEPTLVPTLEPTLVPTEVEIAELRTADNFRALGTVNGWVSGGDGDFVQGAAVTLFEDFDLMSLPAGAIFEHECVQYRRNGDTILARAVCGDDAVARFTTESSIVPAGTTGTFWMPGAVFASGTEEWAEGFKNEPCACADGDCRDE